MNKRILIILGIVVGLIIVGLILFLVLYPGKTSQTITTVFGLFPGGGEKITTQPGTGGQAGVPPTIQPGQEKPLIQLTQKAVSGATFASNGMVRYIEKSTGNIYDIASQGGNANRISNTTLPGIFESYWSPNGEQVVVRYVEKNESSISDVIRNFSVTSIDATSTSIKGVLLLSSIETVSSSPKENKIFYMIPLDGANVGITASFEDKKQKQILSTPFGEWISAWPSERVISLLSKPSAIAEGYLYKLDPVSGAFERVLPGINGLTALWSPDANYVLYSESGYDNFRTFIYSVKDKKVSSFDVTTLPEKCVWSKINKGIVYCAVPASLPSAKYPDDWYQGLISFNDQIWKIDILKGTTEIIPFSAGMNLDIVNLFFNKNEDHLLFQNKYDGTLWSLHLTE